MLAVQLSNAFSVPLIEQVGAAGTAWLRMCFGALFLAVIAGRAIRTLRLTDLPALLLLGTVTGLMTTLFLAAIERIPLGTAVAIEFLGPLAVAGLMAGRRRALIWPLIACIGVVLLTEPWGGEVDLIGVAFALAAGACWGVYNLLTQHIGDRFTGIRGLSLTIPIAALVTTPVGLPQVLTGDMLVWVFFAAAGVALISPVIAFALEMIALRRMTHTAFGTLLSIEPAFGVCVGLVVLSQSPTVFQILGIVLVIVAGASAQRDGSRHVAAAEAETSQRVM